ncbi:MAG: NAD(P)/FAD-dependent oxidoreductase [Bifidobacteriaceae bacterium]|jgi:glutathione reductase (NADPH)|nr:NAD(P)/FAD-dependent oxidoreductase [Bifidobacteriaceae bacterium]
MENFDTIVIGAGPAGLAAAYPLAAAHKKVLVVESDLWGGTCPNRGCDPKKMLYSAVETKQAVGRMRDHGIDGDVSVDWPDLMAFKRAYTSKVPQGTQQGLENSAIATAHGQARFLDAHTITVSEAGEGDSAHTYQAETFIIATGERARPLDIPGAELLGTSTDFLDFDELPKRLVFIGGGYISFELANIAAEAGSTVTLIHHNDRPLRAFPETLVNQLMELMTARGIDIRLSTQVSGAARDTNGRVRLDTDNGVIVADAVINATGRIPNVDGLGLEAAGVDTTARGIVVDDRLRTSTATISAIGDVVARVQPKLTPVAGFEGRYVAARILETTSAAIEYPDIPTIVFGTEKLAQIGVTIDEANKSSRYAVKTFDTTHWYTYNRVQDPQATVMVVEDSTRNNAVVGVAALSSVADEIINQYAEKFAQGETPSDSTAPIYAYPSPASDLGYFA